jgi:ABC-2 type transport system permease protein
MADVRMAPQKRLRWELLARLIRKDLKIKYKDSTLGFAWSMANPLVLLAVYYFVFAVVLRVQIPSFTVYLMSGLLVWQFFQASVQQAAGSIIDNANLVRKVPFPLLVLPLSAVGFAGVHFLLQMLVFVVALAVVQYDFIGLHTLLLLPAILVALTFTLGLSTLVSALNVRYRDVSHILEVLFTAWFWLNPIVYAAGLVRAHISPDHSWLYRVYFLNPPGIVSATFQRAIYGRVYNPAPRYRPDGSIARDASGQVIHDYICAAPGYAFYLEQLGACLVISAVLLMVALRIFRRMSADFAEEL